MRLLKYLQPSGLDDNTNKFRLLNIKLSNKKTNYEKMVKNIEEKYVMDNSILKDINKLNKELKKVYSGGKWWFDLCLEEGKDFDNIRLNKRAKRKLQDLFIEINEKFSNLKFDLERKIMDK